MVKVKSSPTVGYSGKVNIKLRKKNRVIFSKTYHNNGTKELFDFLSLCIVGQYQGIEAFRPKYIKLFSIGNSGDPNPYPDIYSTFASLVENSTLLSLTTIPYSGEPKREVDVSADGHDYGKSFFKFVIPLSQLSSHNNINMIALYSSAKKDRDKDASMFIIITDENDSTILSDILSEASLNPNMQDNEYNLLIEWVTTFRNEGEN